MINVLATPFIFSAILIVFTMAMILAVIAFSATALILFILLRTGWAWRIATDVPNHRSLHQKPTPRTGGWGIIPVISILIVWIYPALWAMILGGLFLAVVSYIDDRRGLSARVRFSAHLIAVAAIVIAYSNYMNHAIVTPWWLQITLIFFGVWLINLYNFMDGADGLAGGMTFFGFSAYAMAASIQHTQLTLSAAIIAGSTLGFLLFNRYPAKIFLGDVGSVPLGFLAGALGFWGWHLNAWPLWFPLMVFSPFIADATVTLLKRLLRGEKFWEGHREHYYQRMILMLGEQASHKSIIRQWYLLMFFGVIISIFALSLTLSLQIISIGIWFLILCLLGWRIDYQWKCFNRVQKN